MKSRQRFSGEPGVHNGSAYHRLVGSLTAPIFIAGALLAFAGLLAAPAQAQTSVPHDWELNPAGFESGDSFRLLFLSADTRNATSSDIGEYNTFVQNLAANGHTAIRAYAAGFRVVGCTNAVDARDNTSTTGTPGVPIYWLNGPKIADDYADFYDGSWDNESNASDRDEDGENTANTSVSFSRPYTGCADDGTEEFFGGDSRALGESTVRQGRLNDSGGPIDGNASLNAAAVRRFYGLSAVFTIARLPPPESSASEPKIIFVPLTARFRDAPAGHDGTTPFALQLAFSEPIRTTAEQLQQALTVTGGTVTSVQQVGDRSHLWEITVTPSGNDAVRISLPPTTSCSAGAICSSNDSKVLQRGVAVSIPRAPLTARFAEVPSGHHGTPAFALHLAFSEPIETTAEALEQALTVTNATVTSVQQVDDRSDLWEITVTPDSNDDVSISLPQTTACDDDNAVCTAEGRMLSAGIAVSVARAPLTVRFERVPEGHIGILFTLHLAFSEPVKTTVAMLTQALTVTGGKMNSLQRVNRRNDLWEVQIRPDAADVNISLPTDYLVRRRGCRLYRGRRGAAE